MHIIRNYYLTYIYRWISIR